MMQYVSDGYSKTVDIVKTVVDLLNLICRKAAFSSLGEFEPAIGNQQYLISNSFQWQIFAGLHQENHAVRHAEA